MNKFPILLFLLSCNTLLAVGSATENKAVALLKATARKLDAIKQVSYTYKREINNYNDNYFDKSSAACFFDFSGINADKMFQFQFNSKIYQQIFNGTEYFELDKSDKTLTITEKTTVKTFSSMSYFYNSIPTLRNMLYTIAEDATVTKAVKDTLMDEKRFHLVQLGMHNKAIDYLTGYRSFKIEITLFYKIIIDPKNGLPYQVIETNSVDQKKYNTKTTFLNMNTSPELPDQNSWYYSTYQNEYHAKEKMITNPLISVGAEMDTWTLPVIRQNRSVNRDDFKGKIVMMDFWIKNCGYCMTSFPYLKALQEKYGKDNFQLLAVNTYDDQKEVDFFYNREKPGYLMVYNGAELAKKMGVQFYPQVVIAGKTGKVIYVGNFDKVLVDRIIQDNL